MEINKKENPDYLIWVKTCHSVPGTPHFDLVLESQIPKFKASGYILDVVHRPPRPAYVVHTRSEMKDAIGLARMLKACLRFLTRILGRTL